jgi:hypothetical protein
MQWADRIGHRVKLWELHILLAVVEWGRMAKAVDRPTPSPIQTKLRHDEVQLRLVQGSNGFGRS